MGNIGEEGGEFENGLFIELGVVIDGGVLDVDDNEDEDKDGGLFRIFFFWRVLIRVFFVEFKGDWLRLRGVVNEVIILEGNWLLLFIIRLLVLVIICGFVDIEDIIDVVGKIWFFVFEVDCKGIWGGIGVIGWGCFSRGCKIRILGVWVKFVGVIWGISLVLFRVVKEFCMYCWSWFVVIGLVVLVRVVNVVWIVCWNRFVFIFFDWLIIVVSAVWRICWNLLVLNGFVVGNINRMLRGFGFEILDIFIVDVGNWDIVVCVVVIGKFDVVVIVWLVLSVVILVLGVVVIGSGFRGIGFDVVDLVFFIVVLFKYVCVLVVRDWILIICGLLFIILELGKLIVFWVVGVIEIICEGIDIGIIGFWKLEGFFVNFGWFVFVDWVDFNELMIFFKVCFDCFVIEWVVFIDFDFVIVSDVGDFSVFVFVWGVCLKLYFWRRELREYEIL